MNLIVKLLAILFSLLLLNCHEKAFETSSIYTYCGFLGTRNGGSDSVFNVEIIRFGINNRFKRYSSITVNDSTVKRDSIFGIYYDFSDTINTYYFERDKIELIDSFIIHESFIRKKIEIVLLLKDRFFDRIDPYPEKPLQYRSGVYADSHNVPIMIYFKDFNHSKATASSSICSSQINGKMTIAQGEELLRKICIYGLYGSDNDDCGPVSHWVLPDYTSIEIGTCPEQPILSIRICPLRKGYYSAIMCYGLEVNEICLNSFSAKKVFLNKTETSIQDYYVDEKLKITYQLNKLRKQEEKKRLRKNTN